MYNSKNVTSAIPVEGKALLDLSPHLDELPVERVLGVRWFVQTDELGIETKALKQRPSFCSLYDPAGFAAPVALTARGLIQDIWKAKLDWDQPLQKQIAATRFL